MGGKPRVRLRSAEFTCRACNETFLRLLIGLLRPALPAISQNGAHNAMGPAISIGEHA